MARKKLISAAILTGMAASGAHAAHGDVSGLPAAKKVQVHEDRDRVEGSDPDEIVAVEAGLDGSPDLIPSFFGGDVVAGRPGDVIAGPDDLDAVFLHHFDGGDGAVLLYDDMLIGAEDEATDDDGFQLAQTIYGGSAGDRIMSPGGRNNTRIPGNNLKGVGSGIKTPRVGSPVTPRTVPNKSLQRSQDVRRKGTPKTKRK